MEYAVYHLDGGRLVPVITGIRGIRESGGRETLDVCRGDAGQTASVFHQPDELRQQYQLIWRRLPLPRLSSGQLTPPRHSCRRVVRAGRLLPEPKTFKHTLELLQPAEFR